MRISVTSTPEMVTARPTAAASAVASRPRATTARSGVPRPPRRPRSRPPRGAPADHCETIRIRTPSGENADSSSSEPACPATRPRLEQDVVVGELARVAQRRRRHDHRTTSPGSYAQSLRNVRRGAGIQRHEWLLHEEHAYL